jgi:hypothetical protein
VFAFAQNRSGNRIDALGLITAAAPKSECECPCSEERLRMFNAVKTRFQSIIDDLTKKGCLSAVECCAKDKNCKPNGSTGGYYTHTTKRIVLCADWASNMSVWLHELQHAKVLCGKKYPECETDPSSLACCAADLCGEMEARMCDGLPQCDPDSPLYDPQGCANEAWKSTSTDNRCAQLGFHAVSQANSCDLKARKPGCIGMPQTPTQHVSGNSSRGCTYGCGIGR